MCLYINLIYTFVMFWVHKCRMYRWKMFFCTVHEFFLLQECRVYINVLSRMLRTCTIWALCTVNVNVLSRILRTCTEWILCTVYNVHCIVQYCVQCSWTYCLECRVFEMVLVPPMDLYRGQRKYRLYRFYCYIVVSSRDWTCSFY